MGKVVGGGIAGFNSVTGLAEKIKTTDGKLRNINQDYLFAVAEGDIANHIAWSKMGYGAVSATTDMDVWSYASGQNKIAFPTSAAGWEVISSQANDAGTVIKGNAQGAAQTIVCDAGGTTTTLNDADGAFTGATSVAVGDVVLLNPTGATGTPEWGYITAFTATQLTFAGGLSSGGSCATARPYTVVDKSASTGAQVIIFKYLTILGAQKTEIVVTNGGTEVATVNTDCYRCNSFRVIAVGSNLTPVGNLSLRATGNTPVYSYITAGFTRARNSAYTVPAGYNLYITSLMLSYATAGGQNKEYGRLITRANIEPDTKLNTGDIFYPFTEVMTQNVAITKHIETPTKLPPMTDLKVSVYASAAGFANSMLRGWLETV